MSVVIFAPQDVLKELKSLPKAINHSMNTEQAAQYLFGTFYAGWVNFLEATFKQPYDQVETKMREDQQFYNRVLLIACRERIPANWIVTDVVKVFDYILSL